MWLLALRWETALCCPDVSIYVRLSARSTGATTCEIAPYNARYTFHRRVRYRALSLRYVCIRSSGIVLIPVPNFVSVSTSVAELAHGEKSRTQSITHPDYLMRREPKLSLRNNYTNDRLLDAENDNTNVKFDKNSEAAGITFT